MKNRNTEFLIFLNQNEWMKALPKPQKSTVTVPFLRKRSPVAVVNRRIYTYVPEATYVPLYLPSQASEGAVLSNRSCPQRL